MKSRTQAHVHSNPGRRYTVHTHELFAPQSATIRRVRHHHTSMTRPSPTCAACRTHHAAPKDSLILNTWRAYSNRKTKRHKDYRQQWIHEIDKTHGRRTHAQAAACYSRPPLYLTPNSGSHPSPWINLWTVKFAASAASLMMWNPGHLTRPWVLAPSPRFWYSP